MAILINGKKVAGLGPPGKSAYQAAVDGGYQGTEEEFKQLLANALDQETADARYLQLTGGTVGDVVFTGHVRLGNSPLVDADAANKAYVDFKIPKFDSITLHASNWSSNTQTVTAFDVLADETKQLIQPMPATASQSAYIAAGIMCTGQAENSLTFTCQTAPTEDITVYVVIQDVRHLQAGAGEGENPGGGTIEPEL